MLFLAGILISCALTVLNIPAGPTNPSPLIMEFWKVSQRSIPTMTGSDPYMSIIPSTVGRVSFSSLVSTPAFAKISSRGRMDVGWVSEFDTKESLAILISPCPRIRVVCICNSLMEVVLTRESIVSFVESAKKSSNVVICMIVAKARNPTRFRIVTFWSLSALSIVKSLIRGECSRMCALVVLWNCYSSSTTTGYSVFVMLYVVVQCSVSQEELVAKNYLKFDEFTPPAQ